MVYTPNTRKCPLLYSTVPRDTPSLPVLFRMCRSGSPTTHILLWGSTPGLSSTFYVSSTPNLAYSSEQNNRGIHINFQVMELQENILGNPKSEFQLRENNPLTGIRFPKFVYGPKVAKMNSTVVKICGASIPLNLQPQKWISSLTVNTKTPVEIPTVG